MPWGGGSIVVDQPRYPIGRQPALAQSEPLTAEFVSKKQIASATWVAREILQEIRTRTGLTASGGVSYNKFLAKIASDVKKPAGLTVVNVDNGFGAGYAAGLINRVAKR